jgi:hypothetical protein
MMPVVVVEEYNLYGPYFAVCSGYPLIFSLFSSVRKGEFWDKIFKENALSDLHTRNWSPFMIIFSRYWQLCGPALCVTRYVGASYKKNHFLFAIVLLVGLYMSVVPLVMRVSLLDCLCIFDCTVRNSVFLNTPLSFCVRGSGGFFGALSGSEQATFEFSLILLVVKAISVIV